MCVVLSQNVENAQSPKMKVNVDFFQIIVLKFYNKYSNFFNLHIVSVQNPDCQTDNTLLYVLSVVVLLGLIVTVLLIYLRTKLKTSLCGCCTGKKCGF